MTEIEPAARVVAPAPFAGRHVAIVSAHCDDETIGAGGQFASMGRISVIHLTDSAPSRRSARAHGFATRAAYARARKQELNEALAVGSAGARWECFALGLPDGFASFQMTRATENLTWLLGRLQPDLVLAQPYEGGHADHDTVAFVARRALQRSGLAAPLWEMTSYHRVDGDTRRGRFLPAAGPDILDLKLDPAARARKAAALRCFRTQRLVVERFSLDEERFRLAPAYDFSEAPHPGPLQYEGRRRALSGRTWRALAAREIGGRPLPPLLRAARDAAWGAWLAR